jgi:hypothetical protein
MRKLITPPTVFTGKLNCRATNGEDARHGEARCNLLRCHPRRAATSGEGVRSDSVRTTQVGITVMVSITWVPFPRTRYSLVLAGNDTVA